MKPILFSIISFFSVAHGAVPPAPFHEVGRYSVGGEGGWDYLTVDSNAHQLYIARGDRIMVVDTDSGKLLHEITGTLGVHGVALDTSQGVGFASNGKAGSVTVFDLKSLKAVGQVAVGQNPDAILYDFFSRRVFTFNGKSKDVSVIDAKERKVVGTIPLGAKPEFAVSDGAGKLFVNLEDENALVRMDAKSLKVEVKYPLAPCQEPTGLSMDPKTRRLFVGCGNKMLAIVDSASGKVLKTIPVGSGVDATFFDAKRNLIFASAGEGKLSVIQEKSGNDFELVQEVATMKGARTMTFDSETGKVFLVSAGFGAPPKAEEHARPPVLPGTFVVIVLAQ